MIKLGISFVTLSSLDIGLTLYFVGAGISYELNPVMARVLTWPLPAILLFKTAIPVLLVICLISFSRVWVWKRLTVRNVLIGACVGEMLICLFNLTGLIFYQW